ncbi:MAG: TonB-dependent receptor [Bacteroidetes bacterium]|nr:TonB-dependent receptor [Bacteroidota bacterium]
MKILYALLFTFTSLAAFAQTLTGKVTDANGNALAGATIQLNGQGTIVDQDGAFAIPCSGMGTLTVRFVGYETLSRSISDCSAELNIQLVASTELLNEVEITATSNQNKLILGQAASIAKIGDVEIKRGTGLFLDDAINANIPGVFMQRRTVSAGQQFNIRGYGGGGPGNRGVNNNFDQLGIKAYLNGIPITDAEGITLMDDIDFASIGNVEIIKGPSSSLYGLAIAGVVNLQTIKPEKNKTSIGQDYLTGTFGLRRYTTNLRISNEKSTVLVNYGRQSYDGFMINTRSRKDFVNMMGEFQLNSKQSLTTYIGFTDSYDQRNGELTITQYNTYDYSGNPAYIKNDAHSNVVSFRAGIGHTYRFNENISNTTSLFGTGLNSNVSSAGGWTDKAPVNYGLRSVFDTKFTFGNIRLAGMTGIEAQQQLAQTIGYPMVVNNANPTGLNIIGAIRSNVTTNASTYSLFTQWTANLPYDISVTAGLGASTMNILLYDKFFITANNTPANTIPTRYETKYENLLSPTFSVNKVFNKKYALYGSFGRGYRAPVSSNIYVPLGGFVNTALQPEMGDQLEFGVKGNTLQDRLTFEVAWFQTKFSNKMTLLGVPNANNTATLYSYVVNAGSQNNMGVEALVKYNLLQSSTGFVKMLRPFANFTYSDFKYEGLTFNNNIANPVADFSGNRVAGVPIYVANGGVDFVSNTGFYANMVFMYRDEMYITPDLVNIAKGFHQLNGRLGFRKSFLSHLDGDVFIGANNMTSQQHYQMVFVNQLPDSYLPGPKDINFFGGASLRYTF